MNYYVEKIIITAINNLDARIIIVSKFWYNAHVQSNKKIFIHFIVEDTLNPN